MFILAFSFANFENWGVIFLGSVVNKNEILAFPLLPVVVSNFANEKPRRNIFLGVYMIIPIIIVWLPRMYLDK